MKSANCWNNLDMIYLMEIIMESFSDITLLRQDINEKENKISDLNHRLEILPEVSELKQNDINNEIAFILLSITSPYLIKLKTIALRSVPIMISTK